MKVITIFGTRPEAIKMFPIVLKLREYNINHKVIITAQHREMLDDVLNTFNIVPDYDFDIMEANQSLQSLSAKLLIQVTDILKIEKPNIVLVHGDTTTAMISALACFYLKIKVGHVEAGLRSNNIYSPFPEEMNRRLIGQLSTINFAPTLEAYNNLNGNAIITGNTITDALKYIPESKMKCTKKIILVTAHRRENIGFPLERICEAIKILSENKEYEIIYPVHLNPLIRKIVYDKLNNINNVKLVEPMNYIDFIGLLKIAYLIMTDSGGIQEEAAILKKRLVILRDNTERPEIIDNKCGVLVGTDIHKIVDTVNNYNIPCNGLNYGVGVSDKIIKEVIKYG
jgi:UDP-N-acetylglucosamine 2-epimerase (non-hydrolysing)